MNIADLITKIESKGCHIRKLKAQKFDQELIKEEISKLILLKNHLKQLESKQFYQ